MGLMIRLRVKIILVKENYSFFDFLFMYNYH